MTIKDLRMALQEGLKAIPGLNIYVGIPTTIVAPFAIITLKEADGAEYDLTSRNSSLIYHMMVDVGVNFSTVVEPAQEALDLYIQNTGDYSVKYALENYDDNSRPHDSFDGLRVTGIPNYGKYTLNGTTYYAARFAVDVIVTSEA